MKSNAPKRQIFDAVDLLTEEPALAPSAKVKNGVIMLPVDAIKPFSKHPFKLYQGERLDDMVESIREHGILSPVIVRKKAEGYEMLSGHNRHNAAKLAGLKEIPAIVKEKLSDDEAWVYVVETNVMQRAFSDLLISERITVLSERYNKICGTKKREEILAELKALEGGGHDVHQQGKSRELIGQEYGMTGRNIARYIRCDQLIGPFKDMLDNGSLALVVGVELSYLSETEQELIKGFMDKEGISLKLDLAKRLRTASGTITADNVASIMGADVVTDRLKDKPVTIKVPAKLYSKYFAKVDKKAIDGILEAALSMYFAKKGD